MKCDFCKKEGTWPSAFYRKSIEEPKKAAKKPNDQDCDI